MKIEQRLRAMRRRFRDWRTDENANKILDHYVDTMPSRQAAVDLIPGWNHSFPPNAKISNGGAPFYNDGRIRWCIEKMGTMAGRSVLELGPLEGFHTNMLAKAGAAHVDAIEANTLAYLRCLVTKEILGIPNASFWLGDFNKWLAQHDAHYDLVVACGVLYHAEDPFALLELIAARGDNLFIWTHYFDEEVMTKGDVRRTPFSGRVVTKDFRGITVEMHERSYYKAWLDPRFCGGPQDRHYWMTRKSILDMIGVLGFETSIADDHPEHKFGPAFSIFAKRRTPPAQMADPTP